MFNEEFPVFHLSKNLIYSGAAFPGSENDSVRIPLNHKVFQNCHPGVPRQTREENLFIIPMIQTQWKFFHSRQLGTS